MSKVISNQEFLKMFEQNKISIKNATKDQIHSICEVILNILNGKIKLKEYFKKLNSKKNQMRILI